MPNHEGREKLCPQCGAHFAKSESFCSKCGNRLVDDPEYARRAEQKKTQEEKLQELKRQVQETKEEYRALYQAHKEVLEAAKIDYYDRRCYSQTTYEAAKCLAETRERIQHLKERLYFLAFLGTTPAKVAEEFSEQARRIRRVFDKSVLKNASQRYYESREEMWKNNNPNVRTIDGDIKARITRDGEIEFIDFYLRGGILVSHQVSWKQQWQSDYFANEVTIERYRIDGDVAERARRKIAAEKDLKKAGLYAYRMSQELDAVESSVRALTEKWNRGAPFDSLKDKSIGYLIHVSPNFIQWSTGHGSYRWKDFERKPYYDMKCFPTVELLDAKTEKY